MCGIVGLVTVGIVDATEKKIFKQLLEVGALRGHHSTGVFGVSNSGAVEVFKRAVSSQEYFEYKGADDILTGNCILVGHNRYATCGALTNANAHPFTAGNITGVHNGTLDNQHDLVDYMQFDVDSENIFHSMDKIGEIETIEKLEGAFTLVWYNKKDGTVNFVRNSERPLAYATIAGTTFFASEKKMLDWVLDRNGMRNYTIHELPVGVLVSVPVGKTMQSVSKTEVKLQPTGNSWGGNYSKKWGRGNRGTTTHVTGTNSKSPIAIGTDVRYYIDSVAHDTRLATATCYGRVVDVHGNQASGINYGMTSAAARDAIGKVYLAKAAYYNVSMKTVVVNELVYVEEEQQKDAPFPSNSDAAKLEDCSCCMCGEAILFESDLREIDWEGDGSSISTYHSLCYQDLQELIDE